MLKYSPVIKEGIPKLKKGSKEYSSYWSTQIDRCKNGYKPSNLNTSFPLASTCNFAPGDVVPIPTSKLL